jgi:hypothetical protein
MEPDVRVCKCGYLAQPPFDCYYAYLKDIAQRLRAQPSGGSCFKLSGQRLKLQRLPCRRPQNHQHRLLSL